MIYIVDKDNMDKLRKSFIKINIEEELKNNPFGKVLVLEENKEIIGYLYYSDIYERAEINQFEINFIHRNCGKGNLLLKEFIKTMDKDITLEVREDNLPAINLYNKNGFIKKSTRKGYYKGIDGYLMERKKDSN